MSLYSKMGEAQQSQGGVYWAEGDYLLDVVKHVEKGDMADAKVILESKVLHVFRKVAASVWTKGPAPVNLPASNRVGESPAQVVSFKHKSAMGNLKDYLIAVSGMTSEKIVELHCQQNSLDVARAAEPAIIGAAFVAIAERVFQGEGTMFAGKKLFMRAVVVPKKDGNPFTKNYYSTPTPEQLAEAGFGPAAEQAA